MLVVDGVQYFGKSLGTYVGLGTNTPLYIGGMNDYSTLSVESGFVTGFAGEAPPIQTLSSNILVFVYMFIIVWSPRLHQSCGY